jgi:hypothetical protein
MVSASLLPFTLYLFTLSGKRISLFRHLKGQATFFVTGAFETERPSPAKKVERAAYLSERRR